MRKTRLDDFAQNGKIGSGAKTHPQRKEILILAQQPKIDLIIVGRGFDLNRTIYGFGLRGMQERTNRLGDELAVNIQPNQGTEVIINITALGYVLVRSKGQRKDF
jgi:glucose-6-phosphate-specific signal transduction histidine kinase